MTTLKEIEEYMITKGANKEQLSSLYANPTTLACLIMEYAHRNQKRLNGDDYADHPAFMVEDYYRMLGIFNNKRSINHDLLDEYDIPYLGVEEVLYLHDVIEDSEVTYEDIKNIYYKLGYEDYFNKWIDYPLRLITHDKKEDYHLYTRKCMLNPISAIAKMIDMIDNLNLSTADTLDDEAINRCLKYLSCIKIINDEYHFIENIKKYRDGIENK